MDIIECQWFFVEDRLASRTGVLPGRNVGEVRVVTQRFTIRRLKLFAEMTSAGLISMQRIEAHQLAELQKIRDSAGIFQRLIQFLAAAEHVDALPEFFAELGNPQ